MPDELYDVYRDTYPKIPALWRAANRALKTMMDDEVEELGKEGILTVEGNTGIRLPNGLYIKYPNLRTFKNQRKRVGTTRRFTTPAKVGL
jgi:hypothetical protein